MTARFSSGVFGERTTLFLLKSGGRKAVQGIIPAGIIGMKNQKGS